MQVTPFGFGFDRMKRMKPCGFLYVPKQLVLKTSVNALDVTPARPDVCCSQVIYFGIHIRIIQYINFISKRMVTLHLTNSYPDAPWDWYIYLHLA